MRRLTATRHDREHEIEILTYLEEHGPTWWTAIPGGACVALHLMRLYHLGHIAKNEGLKPWRAELTAVGREYLDWYRRRAS